MPDAAQEQGGSFALTRVVREEDDLDFAPDELRRIRRLVRSTASGSTSLLTVGGVVAGAAAVGMPASAVLMAGLYALGFGVVGGLGVWWLADGPARRSVRRKLEALARGKADLPSLRALADGELVRVRGKVVAPIAPLPMSLLAGHVVVQRLRLNVDGTRVVFDTGADFSVEEEDGTRTRVEIAGAVLIGVPRAMPWIPVPRNNYDQLVNSIPSGWFSPARRNVARKSPYVGELVIQEGDLVDVVGSKRRAIDTSITERLAREAPFAAVLGSGKRLPLLLAPVEPRVTR